MTCFDKTEKSRKSLGKVGLSYIPRLQQVVKPNIRFTKNVTQNISILYKYKCHNLDCTAHNALWTVYVGPAAKNACSNNFAILPITYSKQCLSITEDSFDLRYLQFTGFREIYA
jgi:hypothetical protein